MRVFVAVDNTDSVESRGTGFRSRQMASELMLAGHGKVLGITRHQLLVDDRLSYTSQNSSNCLEVETPDIEKLWDFCRRFIIREALPGSIPGLCLAPPELVTPEIEQWGIRAKREILLSGEASELAAASGIMLEGLSESQDGIIGALAAVGLRHSGNDGRFIWQPGKQIRDMQGAVTVQQLLKGTLIHGVMTRDGKILNMEEMIDLSDWVRAVLINRKAWIIAEKNTRKSGNYWRTADRVYLKDLSS